MSWDISLVEKKLVDVEVVEIGNYTWNVSGMYVEAMGVPLSAFNSMRSERAIPFLRAGVKRMLEDPDKYRAMNPLNGWGNYEGALEYLQNLLQKCEENPRTIISIT